VATKPPKTPQKVKHEGGIGLKKPGALTPKQVRSLAGSVEAHIEPRGKGKKK
jgi:hypothetical protein